MEIYNTLTGKKEGFAPLRGKDVNMYVCGITPYDRSHLGHARTLVSFDVIRRYLLFHGYSVKFVQNVTDIDDKIIRRAKERGMAPLELSEKFALLSEKEFEALGMMKPDLAPKVSQHIPTIIALIGRIEKNGYAYTTESGVYFDVLKFKGYGKLSGQSPETIKAGARIEVDEKKRNPQDFALWKFGEEPGVTFPSPWGNGRPGWHIECSAMATALLGETLDIHGGARDLIFPHHENEVAQSEAATGKPFVRHWVHTGFLTVNGEKMAKSLGNFITIEDGLKKFSPQQIRMLFVLSHYRSPMDFSEDAVVAAGNALSGLHSAISAARTYSSSSSSAGDLPEAAAEAERKFLSAMDDDFDTPAAMSALFALAKRISGACSEGTAAEKEVKDAAAMLEKLLGIFNLAPAAQKADAGERGAIGKLCREFGLGVGGDEAEMVEALISFRNEARKRKDFAISDTIRGELLSAGIVLEDRKDGTVGWHRKA
ncbi:Cysteine--tRNA ligase [uncultured archaeon]|nr:Cysteine--tRNA ligase [uncultured archaeon]